MIYINSAIDRKGILTIRVVRDGKDIFTKNIWVKRHDNILIKQIHKNDKSKGNYLLKEKNKNMSRIKMTKKDRYIMEQYMGNKLKSVGNIPVKPLK
jgi:hypothetical protein